VRGKRVRAHKTTNSESPCAENETIVYRFTMAGKKNAQDSRLACSVNVAEHDSAVFRSTTRIGSS
jgi:hypothetical protein